MRLRLRRETPSPSEPPPSTIAAIDQVDPATAVTWSVDQLNALGPVTGPGHRTSVPIVRGTMMDGSLGDPPDSAIG
jgi:hypothetical protein